MLFSPSTRTLTGFSPSGFIGVGNPISVPPPWAMRQIVCFFFVHPSTAPESLFAVLGLGRVISTCLYFFVDIHVRHVFSALHISPPHWFSSSPTFPFNDRDGKSHSICCEDERLAWTTRQVRNRLKIIAIRILLEYSSRPIFNQQ